MGAIARRLGVKPRFVQYTWSNLVPSLERGDFDVAMNGLEATQERRDRILLSDPDFVYAETLTIRAADPDRSIFDLAGKRIGPLNQTYAHDSVAGKRIGTLNQTYARDKLPLETAVWRATRSRIAISSTAASMRCCSTTSSWIATAASRPGRPCARRPSSVAGPAARSASDDSPKAIAGDLARRRK